MPTPKLTRDVVIETIRVYEEKKGNMEAAANALGIASQTLFSRLRRGKALYGLFPVVERKEDVQYRREVHDAGFWKKRAEDHERSLREVEHLLEEISGIRNTPYTIPSWLLTTDNGQRGRSVIGCLLSDVHMGEVISDEEIHGINRFDPEICRARLRRYFQAACIVGARWSADTVCEGVLLALAGDMISGDIHEELRITNALTSHEQVLAVVEEVVAGIRVLLLNYPRVHVVSVPGNHGRTTPKPTAKMYSRLSYDTLIATMVAKEFANVEAVTFQFGAATDQITPVFGRTILTTHGDKIGTKGGMGFAGPDLPIVRGAKKVLAQQHSVGWSHDLIQFGHYHYSTNPGGGRVLGNGSVPGYSEYGADLRAVVEPPQQWLYLIHSKWWLRERAPIQLEEPKALKKPRVRVPAAMAT